MIHLLTTIIPSGPELWTDAPNHCLDLSSITTPDALLFPEIAERNKDFNSSKMVPFKTLLLRVANKENQRQNAFFMCLLLSNLFFVVVKICILFYYCFWIMRRYKIYVFVFETINFFLGALNFLFS